MNQQQASHLSQPIEFIGHPSTLAPEITFEQSQQQQQQPASPPRQAIAIDWGDAQMNAEQIKARPELYIDQNTSRDTLFRIAYLLEEENEELWGRLKAECRYILGRDYREEERQNIMQEIKARNLQYQAQKKLHDFYRRQQQELKVRLWNKQTNIKKLAQVQEQKQREVRQSSAQLKVTSDRLIELKQRKTKLTDQLKNKKIMEKGGESGLIDRLLAEYYETINDVMTENSIDKLNYKTGQAISDLYKRKSNSIASSFADYKNV